jgi:hypothetical protein
MEELTRIYWSRQVLRLAYSAAILWLGASVVLALMPKANSGGRQIKVARRAKVSTWLVYSPGAREQIQEAITKQRQPKQTTTQPAGIESLRTDLALARQEISALRREREVLRTSLRQALGRQLNNLSTAPLVDRLNRLAGELVEARASNTELNLQITNLQDDLTASRTSLRRMIREQNSDTSR